MGSGPTADWGSEVRPHSQWGGKPGSNASSSLLGGNRLALSGMFFSLSSCLYRFRCFHVIFHPARVRHLPRPSPCMRKPCISFQETLEQSSHDEIALLCCRWPIDEYLDARKHPVGWCRLLGATAGVESTMGAELLLLSRRCATVCWSHLVRNIAPRAYTILNKLLLLLVAKTLVQMNRIEDRGPHVACEVKGKSAVKPKALLVRSGVIFDCVGLY